MNNIKIYITKSSEFYLMLLVLFCGFTPPYSFNVFFIGLAFILGLQILFKKAFSGLLLAAIFLLINIYLLFAFASELSEFTSLNAAAIQLLLGGIILLGVNFTVAGFMISKYSSQDTGSNKEAIVD